MSAIIKFEINDKAYDELLDLVKESGVSEHDFCVVLFENAIAKASQPIVQLDRACTCKKPTWVHDDGLTFYCAVCGKPPRH